MLRIGIVGTGRIAGRFLAELAAVDGIAVSCVYNPNLEGARRLAEGHGIPSYTNNMDELTGNCDAVYIASPHQTHYPYAKGFLQQGKHVLCEKPLALCEGEARELFRIAKQQRLVLMEAIKTAWCPGYLAMVAMARSGRIGQIRDVEACFTKLTPMSARELTDTHYGGSFTELGTYVMLPILELLGTGFEAVHFRSLRADNGLDGYTKAEFVYPEACGLGKAGLLAKSEGQLVIAGTTGYILAKSPWWLTRGFAVRHEDPSCQETYTYEFQGAGLRYELRVFVKAVQAGADMPGELSISMARVMGHFLESEQRHESRSQL